MSDQGIDPWARVLRHMEQRGGFLVTAQDVRAVFTDEARRHAEQLDALKATHEATLAAIGRSHAQALEKVRAQSCKRRRGNRLRQRRSTYRCWWHGQEVVKTPKWPSRTNSVCGGLLLTLNLHLTRRPTGCPSLLHR